MLEMDSLFCQVLDILVMKTRERKQNKMKAQRTMRMKWRIWCAWRDEAAIQLWDHWRHTRNLIREPRTPEHKEMRELFIEDGRWHPELDAEKENAQERLRMEEAQDDTVDSNGEEVIDPRWPSNVQERVRRKDRKSWIHLVRGKRVTRIVLVDIADFEMSEDEEDERTPRMRRTLR